MQLMSAVLCRQNQANQRLMSQIQLVSDQSLQLDVDHRLPRDFKLGKIKNINKPTHKKKNNPQLQLKINSQVLLQDTCKKPQKQHIFSQPMKIKAKQRREKAESTEQTTIRQNAKNKANSSSHQKQIINLLSIARNRTLGIHPTSQSINRLQRAINFNQKGKQGCSRRKIKTQVNHQQSSQKSLHFPVLKGKSRQKLNDLFKKKRQLHQKLSQLNLQMESIRQANRCKITKIINQEENWNLQTSGEVLKAKKAVEFIEKINRQTKDRKTKNMLRESKNIQFSLGQMLNKQPMQKSSPTYKKWFI